MSDTQVARRYARALVEVAVESGRADAVLAEMVRVLDALQGDGQELFAVLRSPLFSAEERAGLLTTVLPRLGVGKESTDFLRFLSDRGRMSLLAEVVRLFREDMDVRAGRIRVEVLTVDPLTPQLEASIQEAFAKATGKTVVIDASIDTSLIGGLVARVGDRVYDASLRARLEDARNRLINASATPEA